MTGAEIDTLVALVERGPLAGGDIPSKSGRSSLIEKGLAVHILVNFEDGYTAATYAGRDAYKAHFGDQESMEEAKAFRQACNAISTVSRRKA